MDVDTGLAHKFIFFAIGLCIMLICRCYQWSM